MLMVINYEASFVCAIALLLRGWCRERRGLARSYRQKHFAKEIIDKKGGTHLPAETENKEKPLWRHLTPHTSRRLCKLKTKCLDDGATVPTLSTGQ